jgi:hypothetical protein
MPLERRRCRWVDNIKMNLGEIRWVVWTGLIWLRIGTSNEASGSIKNAIFFFLLMSFQEFIALHFLNIQLNIHPIA